MKSLSSNAADLAVIGISCRFPGCADYASFWRLLAAGENHITEIPPERWRIDPPERNGAADGPAVGRWGGFLVDIDRFDHRFFGISPREATRMDPQQRLLLEEVWRCVEDAGLPLRELQLQRTAVYVGGMTGDYEHEVRAAESDADAYACSGSFRCMLANRISHHFDFRGPSVSVDTACSSSLVALHQARTALAAGECDYAIVAGVSLNLNPWKFASFSRARMLSPDGQCKTFDQAANGYVPGEGVGAILLQRRDHAEAARAHVHGLVKGSAVNHGGHAASLTAPRVEAQRDVITAAWRSAGLSPATCGYIEAHGTGTSLGDPIEVEALTQAFQAHGAARGTCRIGSVKTNIGHLEPAAGLAGLIKVLLMMQARRIPASLNVSTLTPLIDFSRTPFQVAREASDWTPARGRPLRAGVSSFGFGGANAHVVVESYARPARRPTRVAPAAEPLLFSAHSAAGLQSLLTTWAAFARTSAFAGLPLSDVAATLRTGRETFPYRHAILVEDHAAAAAALAGPIPAPAASEPSRVCLVLGEPATVPAALNAARLRAASPLLAEAWGECTRAARRLGTDLERPGRRSTARHRRLLAFALQYAVGRQFAAALPGLECVSGEGAGYWAALAVAGLLSPAEAMRLATGASSGPAPRYRRPQLAFLDPASRRILRPFTVSRASLAALARQAAQPARFDELREHARELAGFQHTFRKNLERWNETLAARGTSTAGLLESASLDPASRATGALVFADALRRLNRKWNLAATLPLSSVQDSELLDLVDDGVLLPGELIDLVRDPAAQLDPLLARIDQRGYHLDGARPYPTLRRGAAGVVAPPAAAPLTALPAGLTACALGSTTAIAGAPVDPGAITERSGLLRALQEVWRRGLDVAWESVLPARAHQRVPLPTCVFAGERFWIADTPARATPPPDLERTFDPAADPVLRDHRIRGQPILPAAALLEAALAFGTAHSPGVVELREVAILRPTVTDRPRHLRVRLSSAGAFEAACDDGIVCTGRIDAEPGEAAPVPGKVAVPDTGWAPRDPQLYPDFADAGYHYGPALQVIAGAVARDGEWWCRLAAPTAPGADKRAALIDGALQAALAAAWHFGVTRRDLLLPYRVESCRLQAALPDACFVRIRRPSLTVQHRELRADLEVFSGDGDHLLQLVGARFAPAVDPLFRPAPAAAPLAAPAAPAVSAAPAARGDAIDLAQLEAELAGMLAETLHVARESLHAAADLRTHGLDSLALTEYAEAVEGRLGVALDTTQLFSHPTLKRLAGHLAQAFPAEMSRAFPLSGGRVGDAAPTPGPAPLPAPPTPTVSVAPAASLPSHDREAADNPIAIVGMAGRFPQSEDLADFWRKLAAGADLVTDVPADRWDWREFFGDPHAAPNRTNSRWGGFLPRIDAFDAAFFRISPKEAALMDPQQRLILELAWQAVEDSGHAPSSLRGSRTGVFVGVCNDDYRELIDRHARQVEAQTSTGTYFSLIPNRVSYWFDWHGPSVALDTACSSSLVALHQAVQAIERGDCDLALAGGVNLCCTPRRHISFSHAGMLSPDGRCRSFDARGRGYVRGEGAGLILLKPLRQALADGNPVYGLIRGSAVNHGGSANSLTAPNPNAQADLIAHACRRAGAAPETLSYIEAHGTGTELGDPIEISALKSAFGTLARERGSPAVTTPYCGIGSVKTNIGHLESAAGIAGVIKVLLAMRHRQLPASLHFEQLNPHIDLAGSPFFIVSAARPWTRLRGPAQQEIPRRAGVSSFGFGGVNAHVVLEEPPPLTPAATVRPREIVVLSARTEAALLRACRALLRWLEAQPAGETDLAALAYTLQVGRDAFEHRSAWVVGSIAELVTRLRERIDAPANTRTPAPVAEANSLLRDEPEDLAFLAELWRAGKLERIARLWSAGASLPWPALAPNPAPRRLSLPGYSFAADRHWISDFVAASAPLLPAAGHGAVAVDAPSSRTIAPDDPLVRHHIVRQRAILPGVVGLSFAHAAASAANRRAPLRFTDVVWLRPVVVENTPLAVRVRLDAGAAPPRYEVVSGDEAAPTVHSSGAIHRDPPVPRPALDLAGIRQRCPETVGGAQVYRTFAECGVDYGGFFQGLQEVAIGSNEFVARLEVPTGTVARDGALPPPILDSAVQITLWWLLHTRGADPDLYLPFSADEVNVIGAPAEQGAVHVRVVEIDRAAGFGRYDVTLTDRAGVPWLELQGFTVRRFKSPSTAATHAAVTAPGPLYRPVWRLLDRPPATTARPARGRRLILRHAHDGGLGAALEASPGDVCAYLGNHYDRSGDGTLALDVRRAADFTRVLAETGPVEEIVYLGAADRRFDRELTPALAAQRQEFALMGLFRLLRAAAASPAGLPQLTVVTAHAARVEYPDEPLDPFAAAAAAFAQVAQREFSGERIRIVDVTLDAAQGLPDALATGTTGVTAWRRGRAWQRELQPLETPPSPPSLPLRPGGNYLIVGGARGLGLETARCFAREAKANLILVGRRPLDAGIEGVLAELSGHGGRALYFAGDIAEPGVLEQIVAAARARLGPLHGAVHSALVLRDARILTLDEEALLAALQPKVAGLVALQAATAAEPLDFLLVHSSLNSLWANAGQANYVAGCAFADARALASVSASRPAVRVINWGFWAETGVVASPAYRDILAGQGVHGFATAEGVDLLRQILAGPLAQTVAAKLGDAPLRELGCEPGRVARLLPRARAGLFTDAVRAVTGLQSAAGDRTFATLFAALADYGRLRLFQSLQPLLAGLAPDAVLTTRELQRQLQAQAARPAQFEALLGHLAAGGLLESTPAGWRRADTSDGSVVSRRLQACTIERAQLLERFADARPYVALMDACLARLPVLLSGQAGGVEILFPGGEGRLVDAIYQGNGVSDHFNRLLAEAVRAARAARSATSGAGPLRILEVGAGVGGTTRTVLPVLEAEGGPIEFHFTDLSPALVQAARERWSAGRPWLSFDVLDLEQPPAADRWQTGSFDVVIATNVLHATRDLRRTLGHLKALLGHGGLLLLNEVTRNQPYLTLTFGWLDGWWRFDDHRPHLAHSPLLAPSAWRRELAAAGFDHVEAWGDPSERDPDASCQTVFVAASDGVIEVNPPAAPARAPAPAVSIPRPAMPLATPASALPQVTAPVAEAVELMPRLAAIIGEAVGRAADDVAPDARFTDLGVDSIVGIAIVNRINRDLGLRLKPTVLFNYTSLADLTAHVQPLLPVAPRPAVPIVPAAPPPAPAVSAAQPVAPAAPASARERPDSGVAIIGMSGRFPGAENLDAYWRNLAAGRESIGEVPVRRWGAHDTFHDPDRNAANRTYLKVGGFLDDIEHFDPLFFDISPREAERMDPQQRLFLEEAWRAIEDAGYSPALLGESRCGVFAAVSKGDYFERMHASGVPLDAHTWIGNETSILSARIAYHLNLKGPAFPVDTACSSSLVALHLACQSILSGECELALVGGAFLLTTPTFYVHTSKTMMLSPQGKCRAFDDGADGFVPGEGVAVVMLKSLEQARADGDRIVGVIRGTGVNQDGRTNGITAPNALSQQSLIETVQARAGIDPATITCVEAHGTGTKLGDPIEVEALTAAFRRRTAAQQFCALGSVKTNIGHTATVAGLAGLLKLVLSFRHGHLAPSLHFETPNTEIDFATSPFFVNTSLRPWPAAPGRPRRAAVSSFGFSGTNGHVIVEEPPAEATASPSPRRPSHLFCLAAKSDPALRRRVEDLRVHLAAATPDPANLAYTLNVGRAHFPRRLACVATDVADLANQLSRWLEHGTAGNVFTGSGARETPAQREAARQQLAAWPQASAAEPSRRQSALLALGRLYAEGATLDFAALHRGEPGRRIALPTYPFDRERCWPWPEGDASGCTASAPAAVATPPAAREEILLAPELQPAPAAGPNTPVDGTWLLVSRHEPPASWRESLAATPGQHWLLLRHGAAFRRLGASEFEMNFADAAAAGLMLRELDAAATSLRGVVCVEAGAEPAALDTTTPGGVLTLLQKLLAAHDARDFTLLTVTRGLHPATSAEASLAGAVLSGFTRMLGAEHGDLVARSVDLDLDPYSPAGGRIVQAEAACRDTLGEVVYRAGVRHAPRLARVPAGATAPLPVNPGRAYLITGGTGGLGLAVAGLLVRRGARKLVLLGRRPLPPRAAWPALVAGDAGHPLRERIRRIQELESAGATVRCFAVDLTNPAALADTCSEVRHELGLIGGVVHCAGTVGQVGTPFARKPLADLAAVLDPKVTGTQVLDHAVRHDPVEFFLLFSSVAGLAPELGVGAADYAAANAFLDAFARHQHARGRTHFRSLGWPSWKDTGIGEVKSRKFLDTGLLALHTDEGLRLLEQAFASGWPHLLPAVVNPARFLPEKLLALAPRRAPRPMTAPRQDLPSAAGDAVRAGIRAILSQQLRIPAERLHGDANFGEFGVDSILLAEFVRKLEAVVGRSLDPSLFLEHPTIDQLAEHLRRDHSAAFGAAASPAPAPGPAPAPSVPAVADAGKAAAVRSAALDEPIAIIGLAGRFPGAEDVDQFWRLLREGRSAVREVPPERWDASRWYSPVPARGRTTGKWGGFLDGIDRFDAAYFGIAPEDAVQMDPLARHFLETSVQTLRDSGYAKEELWNSRTGVFVGSRISHYASQLPDYTRGTIVGIGQNFIAAQAAQFLHWRGPILVLDTACSSSLVALHYACQSLRNGECSLALAGGVDLLLDEKIFLMLSEAGVLSPDGRCHTFDARANGYVPGEGCGAVLLKPLSRALADGDRIRAVLIGSALNNDGHTMGITTPNPAAQEELVTAALRQAGVSASSISLIEAHGTGTMIGDPMELRALTRAFQAHSAARQYCAIGSVKTNVGHLHSAAGIASVAKAILALEHREIPPTLNCDTPNPRFAFDESPFFPATALRPWDPREGVRRCGISSFGFGGTNCHVVLEEAPAGGVARRAPLPPVVFQRRSFWPRAIASAPPAPPAPPPLLVLEEVNA